MTGVKADIFAVHRFADEGSVFAYDDHHLIGSRGAFDGGAGIDQSAHMPGVSALVRYFGFQFLGKKIFQVRLRKFRPHFGRTAGVGCGTARHFADDAGFDFLF